MIKRKRNYIYKYIDIQVYTYSQIRYINIIIEPIIPQKKKKNQKE